MSEKTQSFTSMAGPAAGDDIPEIGVGMLGYAFMGKAHSNAFRTIPYMMYPPPAIPRMVSLSGRNAEACADAAERYGYEKFYTDWREQVEDPAQAKGLVKREVVRMVSPGTNLEDALDLARYVRKLGHFVEQVQVFTPTPMTASTCRK